MSIIVVRKEKLKIVIGCDTLTSWDVGYKRTDNDFPDSNHSKVMQFDDLTIGMAGPCSDSSFMRLFARNHKPLKANEDGILDFMVEFIAYAKTLNSEFKLGSVFLFVYKGKIFEFWSDLDINPVKEYAAIGSGMFVALGVLYTGGSVKQALEGTCQYIQSCAEPIRLYEIPLK